VPVFYLYCSPALFILAAIISTIILYNTATNI
jgi:hypothetical protein